ncbi:hypothetical protein NDA01_24120 [Trichocoleus desertorum AS-A10]|uniref:hypothetical protein n=1 Tax=Trichocoleus desertorum TaxID=1481672 RepID=UPI003297F5D4
MQELNFSQSLVIVLRGQTYTADLNQVSDIYLLTLLNPFKNFELRGDEQELIRLFISPSFQASFANALRHIFSNLPESLVYYRGENDWRFNLKTSDILSILQSTKAYFEQEAIAQSPQPEAPTPAEDDTDRPLTQRDLMAILEAANNGRPEAVGFGK